MEISAINFNNTKSFKGYNDDAIDVPSYTIKRDGAFDKLDNVDFHSIAQTIDHGHGVQKATSPIRFFLVTAALAGASMVAFRTGAMATMKTLDNKLGLFNRAGKVLSEQAGKFYKNNPEMTDKTAKAFFVNISRNTLTKLMKFGKKGANLEEVQKVGKSVVYAKNALQKTLASSVGVGAAGCTVASRYADNDGNGIPDKAEKVLSTAKEVMEIVPAVASAISLC